jgi:TonB family protein
MRLHSLLLVAGMAVAAPALAQTPAQQPAAVSSQQAAQNAINWDIFLKLYPKRALAAHEEGAVGFTVTLDSKGDVTNCQVTRSSGHPLLDQETCKLVTMNAVFSADPNVSPSQNRTHQGVINWRLPNSTAPVSAPTAIAANDAPEKVVCKKTMKTGSNASYERTCMTPTEWAKQRDQATQPWDEMQGRKGSTAGQ